MVEYIKELISETESETFSKRKFEVIGFCVNQNEFLNEKRK